MRERNARGARKEGGNASHQEIIVFRVLNIYQANVKILIGQSSKHVNQSLYILIRLIEIIITLLRDGPFNLFVVCVLRVCVYVCVQVCMYVCTYSKQVHVQLLGLSSSSKMAGTLPARLFLTMFGPLLLICGFESTKYASYHWPIKELCIRIHQDSLRHYARRSEKPGLSSVF